MMGGWGFGTGGGIWYLVVAALLVVPFWRLLPRFGIPPWVAIFTLVPLVPLVALVLLWVMAFKDEIDGGRA